MAKAPKPVFMFVTRRQADFMRKQGVKLFRRRLPTVATSRKRKKVPKKENALLVSPPKGGLPSGIFSKQYVMVKIDFATLSNLGTSADALVKQKTLEDIDLKPNTLANTLTQAKRKATRQATKMNTSYSLPQNKHAEHLLEQVMALGWPFVKHRKTSYAYKRSLELVEKYFKRYRLRVDFMETVKLGAELMSKTNWRYNWPKKKISVHEFFEMTDNELNMKRLHWLEVKSWFAEFAKGREYAMQKHCYMLKDKWPELTKHFQNIFVKYNYDRVQTIDDLTFIEKEQSIKFIRLAKRFVAANPKVDSVGSLIEIIRLRFFTGNAHAGVRQYMNYFTSRKFWSHQLIIELVRYGKYQSQRQIKRIL